MKLTSALVLCLAFCSLASAQTAGGNLSSCMNVFESCNHAKLSQREAVAVAAAEHQRDVHDCSNGWTCDTSKLTPSEAKFVAATQQKRNLSDCMEGSTS